jgi:hypothetical protein
VPQEWLVSFVVAITARYHLLVALAMAMAAIPVAVLASIYLRSRDRASPAAIAAVLLFTGVALVASFGIRAQVFGWGCFAAFLLCLDRRDKWAYAAVPIVVLWANLHASVMLAPAYLLLRLFGQAATDGIFTVARGRDLRILALTLPAILCTPLGWHLPAYALMLSTSPIRHFIEEWQPVTFHDAEFVIGGLPLAMLVAAGLLANGKRNIGEALPVAALFVAMLLAVRNIPLFAIAAAPLAAQSLDALLPSFSRIEGRIAEMERFALVSMSVAIIASTALLARIAREAPPRTSSAAIASLGASGAQRRLFCENFYACSAALQYPSVRVFMDGRADPYPLGVWRSYISVIRVEPSWQGVLRSYKVDAVLASRGSPLATALAKETNWKPSFRDDAFVVFRYE